MRNASRKRKVQIKDSQGGKLTEGVYETQVTGKHKKYRWTDNTSEAEE